MSRRGRTTLRCDDVLQASPVLMHVLEQRGQVLVMGLQVAQFCVRRLNGQAVLQGSISRTLFSDVTLAATEGGRA